jgi:hypothetical protein
VQRALVMVMLGGCWSSPSPAPEPVHNTAFADPLEVEPVPQHSVWRGKYNCRQGVTALELTIDVTSNGDANALFVFGPHEQNPNLPPGSYRMTGTVREMGPVLQVRLAPLEWLERPENYVMVGINADSDRARHKLTGRITDEGCSGVELRRIR